MEKILVDSYGSYMVYDTDTNSLISCNHSHTDGMIKVDNDAQVITCDEVIDVKAGSIIIPRAFYSIREDGYICKVIVIEDPVALHDLEEFEKLREEHRSTANELS